MGRFIGGRFGSIVPIAPGTDATSAIYSIHDQYYSRRDGGWVSPQGMTATGGEVSDYVVGSDIYRAHVFTSSGAFNVTAQGTLSTSVDVLVVGSGGGGGSSGGGGGG